MEQKVLDRVVSREVSRRRFLALGVGAAVTVLTGPGRAKAKAMREKALSLYNMHTGERLRTVYWCRAGYVPEALSDINHLLRDHRTGDVHRIEPRLLDLLYRLTKAVDTKKDYHVVSGYRSPATNAMLRSHGHGVARHSLHMQGKAIDIQLPGCDTSVLRRAALSLRAGGVGYYPGPEFVHVDVGRVRYWSG